MIDQFQIQMCQKKRNKWGYDILKESPTKLPFFKKKR